MKNCKHEETTGYMWREHKLGGDRISRWDHAFTQPGKVGHHDRIVCRTCGAWLPLGHSDEHASEAVEIEIRAAELAAAPDNESMLEWAGRRHFIEGHEMPTSSALAGWLAAAIATHDDEGGES